MKEKTMQCLNCKIHDSSPSIIRHDNKLYNWCSHCKKFYLTKKNDPAYKENFMVEQIIRAKNIKEK